MALTLVFRIGDVFYVGDTPWEVVKVGETKGVTIRNDGKTWVLNNESAEEIAPDVLVSEGYKSSPLEGSLCFQAPRSISILREQLYLRSKTVVEIDDS